MKLSLPLTFATIGALGANVTLGSDSSSQDTALDEVVVTARMLLPAQTTSANKTGISNILTPQAIQVIPREVIDDQQAMTLAEATRNVAGVSTDFGFNGESEPLLILRGFPSTSMTAQGSMSGSSNYYIDGAKVSGVPVNMAVVRSVEVVKGPNSVLFGRGEPGGLVNVVTQGLAAEPSVNVEQTLGQYGLTRTVISGGGAVNGDETLLVGGSASKYDTKSVRDFVEDHIQAGGLRAQWSPTSSDTVRASVDYTDHRYRTDYGLPAIGNHVVDLPLSTQYNDAPQLSNDRTLSLRADFEHAFANDWRVKIRGVKVTSDTREVDIAPYRVDLSGSGACDFDLSHTTCRYYFYVRPNGKYAMHQVTADLTGKFKLGRTTHNVLVGAENYSAEKTGTSYFEQVSSVDIYHPALGSTPALDLAMAMPMEMEDRNRWSGIYAQDQVEVGKALNLVLAVRHDRTEAIYAAPGTAPNEISFTSPRVGVVWAVEPNHVVYGQYQKALATNNGRDVDGITPLAPETATQFELGYKYLTTDNRLSANLALYQLTKRNRADYSLFPIAILTTGEARSRGVEVDVLGRVNPRLSLIGSYAYTNARVLEDSFYAGKALANVPRNAASLWASYEISKAWRGGVGAFYQGDRWGDIGNTFVLPAYTRMDAMAGYSFDAVGGKLVLQLNINNLFNTRYYTGAHQFSTDWIRPGAPRTFVATLRLAY